MIQAGTIVEIQGLTSPAGQELNGLRAAVIRQVPYGRWQVRVELEMTSGATKALKSQNITPIARLPLPTGPNRGNAGMHDMDNLVPKLCELLLYYKGHTFRPSEIMFTGYAAMAFSRMGESNFMYFVPVQMEQMGGVLALANICKEAEEPGTESVLFGLLEGDPMYIDVLIQTLHWTGLIIEDSDDADPMLNRDFGIPPTQLTPDQDSEPYVKTMSQGPLLLLTEMTKYVFAPALWAALARSEFYHLLVQRLLRFVAREAMQTRDGRNLGKMARRVLVHMVNVTGLDSPVPKETGDYILQQAGEQLISPRMVTVERVQGILNGPNEA